LRKISEIMPHLTAIPGALIPIEPELANRGNQPGKRTLWEVEMYGALQKDEMPLEDKSVSETPEFDELFEFAPDIENEQLERALGGDAGDEIQRAVEIRGIDALGWYMSFHYVGAQWGIYLPVSGILFMATRVFNNIDAPIFTKIQMSIRAIHQHELFHFAADYMSSQLELLTESACFNPSREMKDYDLGYIPEEEKLANANMIRSFWGRRFRGKTAALRNFVLDSPPGYRDGGKVTNHKAFNSACNELGRIYAASVSSLNESILEVDAYEGYRLLPEFPIDWRYCPIHLLNDHDRLDLPEDLLDFFSRVSTIAESDRFRKNMISLPIKLQRKWESLKQRLSVSIAGSGVDFKMWKREKEGSIYSVRLTRKHRAHLLHNKIDKSWLALDIGTHKQMGHG
jgi:hypothetical protein